MRTAIITGASTGLGLECARALLRRDAWRIVLAVRDPARGAAAVEQLGAPQRCTVIEVDLGSLQSVHTFVDHVRAADLPPIHAIVCNAGVQVISGTQQTVDGFEMTFGVNHLGHFALVQGLLDKFSRPARILVVSSGTHDPGKRTGMPEPRYTSATELAATPADRRIIRRTAAIHRLEAVQLALHLRVGPSDRPRGTRYHCERVRPRPDAGLGSGTRLPAAAAVGVAILAARAADTPAGAQHANIRCQPGSAGGRSAIRRRDGQVLRRSQAGPVIGRFLRSRQVARSVGIQRRLRARGHGASTASQSRGAVPAGPDRGRGALSEQRCHLRQSAAPLPRDQGRSAVVQRGLRRGAGGVLRRRAGRPV